MFSNSEYQQLEAELKAVTETLDTCRRERGEALDKLAEIDLQCAIYDGTPEFDAIRKLISGPPVAKPA